MYLIVDYKKHFYYIGVKRNFVTPFNALCLIKPENRNDADVCVEWEAKTVDDREDVFHLTMLSPSGTLHILSTAVPALFTCLPTPLAITPYDSANPQEQRWYIRWKPDGGRLAAVPSWAQAPQTYLHVYIIRSSMCDSIDPLELLLHRVTVTPCVEDATYVQLQEFPLDAHGIK